MALTSKKQRFADAKLAGRPNKDAAIEAGYSAATASAAGARLVKDPDVKAYIARATNKTASKGAGGSKNAPPLPPPALTESDPLKFLEGVMTGRIDANITQVRAATAMLPFVHPKLGEGGKKDKKMADAEKVAKRFAQAAPPRLAAAGGKKVL